MRRIQKVTAMLVGLAVGVSTGCATLAHRSSSSKDSHLHCDGHGEYCPWLIGDALLLIPGIVPGVIAFVVDLGTGEYRHGSATSSVDAPTETLASAR